MGAAYWKLDRLFEALRAFETALELDPEETADLIAASEIALLIGDTDKHRRYSRRAHHFGVEEDTDELLKLLREFGQKDIGNAGLAEHDRKTTDMDAVIRLNPDNVQPYLTRGLAHYCQG